MMPLLLAVKPENCGNGIKLAPSGGSKSTSSTYICNASSLVIDIPDFFFSVTHRCAVTDDRKAAEQRRAASPSARAIPDPAAKWAPDTPLAAQPDRLFWLRHPALAVRVVNPAIITLRGGIFCSDRNPAG